MTDQEKQTLKSELMKEILEEINGQNIKDASITALKTVREQWFRCDDKKQRYYESIMAKVFPQSYWKVWDLIRLSTCYICGEKYVRNLRDTEFANYAADKLCQTIYDLRVEFNDKYGKGE